MKIGRRMKLLFFKSFIQTAFIASIAYFNPILATIYLILIVTGLDMVTGIMAAVKIGGWKAVQSHIMGRSIIKILAYLTAVLVSFGCGVVLLGEGVVIAKAVAGAVILVETASLFENLGKITNKSSLFIAMFGLLKTKLNTNKDILNKMDYKVKPKDEPTSEISVSGDTSNQSEENYHRNKKGPL
jgi:hypothetical protein